MKALKNIRLKNYDYASDGYYFVTLIANHKLPYLKNHKNLIKAEVNSLNHLQGVRIDYYTIMSNHLHVIIALERPSISLGEIVRRFKARLSRATGLKLWQPNYYEHVIRNEKGLSKIREYIQNNPEKEKIELEQFYKEA